METKIVNATCEPVYITEGHYQATKVMVTKLSPEREFVLRHNPRETYSECFWVQESKSLQFMHLNVIEAEEIRIYKLPDCSRLQLRICNPDLSYRNQEFVYFDAFRTTLREDASSSMEIIDASCARLEKLKKKVKICPAQCKNLVQVCLEGIKHMKEIYTEVTTSDDYLWSLYSSKKLRYLIPSLERLLSTLESIEDLMRTCGRQWCKVALSVSAIPFPPSEQTSTKFDFLLKELSWSLDTIRYVLAFEGELNWDDDECRYVLRRNLEPTAAAATEIRPVGTNSLFREDRVHLLNQAENGESVPSISVAHLCGRIYSTYLGNEQYFAREVLKGRLQDYGETSQSNDVGAVPDCFQLNPLHLDIIEELSRGNLKAIYRGKWRGEDVAIGVTKHLEHGSMRESVKQDSQKEAALMLKVQHPNVVEFFGYAFTDNAPPFVSSGKKDAEPVSASFLVMELMQGDLQREIQRLTRKNPGRPFPDDVTVDILLQIVEAMSHIHDCGVIYRDLKAKNCLVNRRFPSKSNLNVPQFYAVKLTDFDISKILDPNASITDHTLRQGTTRWMAPEVWGIGVYVSGATGQKSAYDNSIDVYSFGMTCYEVISGEVPFHECRINCELESALQKEERPVLPRGVTCPERLVELMSRCWSQDPKARPDFKEIRKVLWTVKYEVEFQ